MDPEEPSDLIIGAKRRYDAFLGTELDIVLRLHQIENLVVVGVRSGHSSVCSVSPEISYMRRISSATPILRAAAASSANSPSIRSSLVTR
jgi:isochorismate hydrolase